METTCESAPAIQIDDSGDEDIAVETLEIGLINDTTAAGNDAPSNAIPNEIEIGTIVTQNTSHCINSDDG